MPLERIFLYLVIGAVAFYVLLMLAGVIVAGPAGLIILGLLAFAGYILWRLVAERARNAEDSYYEDNFDK